MRNERWKKRQKSESMRGTDWEKSVYVRLTRKGKNRAWSIYLGIFTLFYVFLPCDSEVRVNLTAVVGSTLKFPDPVKERAFLLLGSKIIASVSKGVFEILEENLYSDRVHWNSSGHFTLSDLQKSDSGVYTIDSKKGTVFYKLYEVKVYDPVPVPEVSCVNISKDSVSVQCSVNKTEHTTLRWIREDRPEESRFTDSQILTVQQRDINLTYKCVADNPADTKTTTVNMSKICEIKKRHSKSEKNNPVYIYIIIAVAVLLFLLLCSWIVKRKKTSSSQPLQTQDSVQYAQINFHKRNGKEPQDALTPSGNSPRADLTTVYDQIQLRRMTPTYSNCGDQTI